MAQGHSCHFSPHSEHIRFEDVPTVSAQLELGLVYVASVDQVFGS